VALGPIGSFTLGAMQWAPFDSPLRRPWDAAKNPSGVFVRREEPAQDGSQRFLVLANLCSHAGCAVSWEAEPARFTCPCHGGEFYADGSRASGPPPRGLYHCVWRTRDGQLEIRPPHYFTLQSAESDTSRSP
jgi:Rieske Fe-S protein